MSILIAAAMSLVSRPLACFVCLVCLWAGTQPVSAATWQEHRDAGFVAFANADYMVSAQHLEEALTTAPEGQASAQERGRILETLATSYLAARWFRRARASISRWDGILATAPGEPWAFQQRIDRDSLFLLVSEVLGDQEAEAAAPVPAPPYEAAGETPQALAEAPAFEAVADVPFAPDVALPVNLASDRSVEAVEQAAAAPPPAAETSAAPDVPAAGGYAIHLVSLTSQEAVDESWTKLQESYPDLLAGKDLSVRQVDLGDRGVFYRIHASSYAASAKAETTCEELRQQQQYCAVVDLE